MFKKYKKSIKLGDYISFILPISQLNNNIKLFDFDFIYSENLGKRLYSDREVHCCFNIYERPINGKINKKQNYNLKLFLLLKMNLIMIFGYAVGVLLLVLFVNMKVSMPKKYVLKYIMIYTKKKL